MARQREQQARDWKKQETCVAGTERAQAGFRRTQSNRGSNWAELFMRCDAIEQGHDVILCLFW